MIRATRTAQRDVLLVYIDTPTTKRFYARWEQGTSWCQFNAKDDQHLDHADLEQFCREYLRLRAEEKGGPSSNPRTSVTPGELAGDHPENSGANPDGPL